MAFPATMNSTNRRLVCLSKNSLKSTQGTLAHQSKQSIHPLMGSMAIEMSSNVADDSRRQRNMHSAAAIDKKLLGSLRLPSLSCIPSLHRRSSNVADYNTVPPGLSRPRSAAPEKKLVCFAVHLAILEKLATLIGALAFIWATVVLLGGFASTLEGKEFWSVTIIIFMQGARIFNRSHELKWQQHVSISRSISHADQSTTTMGQQAQCSPTPEHVNMFLCFQSSVFLPRLLALLQILSAVACAFLSVMGIFWEFFDHVGAAADTKNRRPALLVFFVLALVEALIFLAEKSYWKYSCQRLLKQVKKDCKLDEVEMVAIKRFLYDTYSRCLSGSIYDGVKMDLVLFSFELLLSDSNGEQLTAARILHKFVTEVGFADDTLRKIGTSNVVIERLIEMLNWKNTAKEEIRTSAAKILSKLAGEKHNALRVAGIPGAMESISSLLYTNDWMVEATVNNLTLLGLLILKKLARDHDNCEKIGNTRGLLPKIINLTSTNERLLQGEVTPPHMKPVRRSLLLINMLVSATGRTGEMLRKEISEIVFTISNIRQILQFGEDHMELQQLGIQVLTSLARDEQARERIGSTGGIIYKLLDIFLKPGFSDDQKSVRVEAGRALAMLALDNKRNCDWILKEINVVGKLAKALNCSTIQIYSSRLLQHLCLYTQTKSPHCLTGVAAAIPTVLKTIVNVSTTEEMNLPVVPTEVKNDMKLLEESIGLAIQLFRIVNPEDYSEELIDVAKKLVEILRFFRYPSIKVPKIRRYGIELAVWLMKSNGEYIQLFLSFELEKELMRIAETTSELECFNSFSGSLGLCRYKTSVSSLADSALKLMGKGKNLVL